MMIIGYCCGVPAMCSCESACQSNNKDSSRASFVSVGAAVSCASLWWLFLLKLLPGHFSYKQASKQIKQASTVAARNTSQCEAENISREKRLGMAVITDPYGSLTTNTKVCVYRAMIRSVVKLQQRINQHKASWTSTWELFFCLYWTPYYYLNPLLLTTSRWIPLNSI